MFQRSIVIAALCSCLLVFMSAPAATAQEKPDALALMRGMSAAYSKVDNYIANFLKQEFVDGELLPQENIEFKFKKPFKVYMGWKKGPNEGREALYVQGRYDNKVVGHEGGFIGFITLHMEPTGSTAMKGNRHPITDSGIGRLIEIVTDNGERALKEGVLSLDYVGTEKVYGRDTQHIRAKLPPDKGYYAGKIDIWIDADNSLPIRIMIYGWDGQLWESYGYKDLKLNPGLTDAEFDEDYKGYDF